MEVHGLSSSCPRSRLTFDESPLRESCTVGSVGEVPGNWYLYPTAPVEGETQSSTADANTERPYEVQDAADVLPIPIPITMCPWEERKAVHAIGLERPPGLGTLENVTRDRAPIWRTGRTLFDGLAIATLAIAKPAKPDRFADRSRPNHYLHHHGTSPPSLPPAALSLGFRRA